MKVFYKPIYACEFCRREFLCQHQAEKCELQHSCRHDGEMVYLADAEGGVDGCYYDTYIRKVCAKCDKELGMRQIDNLLGYLEQVYNLLEKLDNESVKD